MDISKKIIEETCGTIPENHVTLLDCDNVDDFIRKNFAVIEAGGANYLICDPENGIALCELFYERVFHGKLFELYRLADYWADNIYRWSEEEDDYGLEFEVYNKYLEDCDDWFRGAYLVRLMINRGIILQINKGKTIGPFFVSDTYANDYYVVKGFEVLLRNGICLDGDSEAENLIKDSIAKMCEGFQTPFSVFVEMERFPEMVSAGLFDSIGTQWLDMEDLALCEHSERNRENLIIAIDYFKKRGGLGDGKEVLERYDNEGKNT